MGLVDLTSLGEHDTPAVVQALCAQALASPVHPAALCVYPEHLTTAQQHVAGTHIRLATVVNFPDGSTNFGRIERETARAIGAGANEIDLVLPYDEIIAGRPSSAEAAVHACRDVCGPHVTLKVILETGELQTTELIQRAAQAGLAGGADFLKTSTGKTPGGATLAAAATLLDMIASAGRPCGLKLSGGIRTLEQAQDYVRLAETRMGAGWISPDRFRIGASTLFSVLIQTLAGSGAPADGVRRSCGG
jgi:deoxyribose-phosphate aldolase